MKLADWQAWAILSGAEKCAYCKVAPKYYGPCGACLGLEYRLYGAESFAFHVDYIHGEL